ENQTRLRDEITDLSARLKESEQELSRRDKELDKLQTANIQAFERIERLRISVDMAEKDNSGLKQVNQELKNDFEFLQRQLHDVQNSLSTIYNSDGWKLLNRYYKFKGRYLHEDSWQYKALKRVFRATPGKTEINAGAPPSPVIDLAGS